MPLRLRGQYRNETHLHEQHHIKETNMGVWMAPFLRVKSIGLLYTVLLQPLLAWYALPNGCPTLNVISLYILTGVNT